MNIKGHKLLKTSVTKEEKLPNVPGSGEETPGSQRAPIANDNRALHQGTKRDNYNHKIQLHFISITVFMRG